MTSTTYIGIGNWKGGVGSTTFCQQLAALLHSLGKRVTIVETASSGVDAIWCVGRAERLGTDFNGPRPGVDYLHIKDLPATTWLRDYELGSDFVLYDHCHGVMDIGRSMQHVDHWVALLGPNEVRHTLTSHDRWCAVHPNAWIERKTYTAVVVVPGPEEIEFDPGFAAPMWNGDQTVGELLRRAPTIEVARHRLVKSSTMADVWGGWDAMSQPTEESLAARQQIEQIWAELSVRIQGGDTPPIPTTPIPRTWFGGRPTPFSSQR